jgi:Uma2 family endonuclease
MIGTRTVSAQDLLRMPDDGFRYELIRGELRQMAPAGHRHGRVAAKLTVRLGEFVIANELGNIFAAVTGFLLATDPDTVRAPDVAFVSRERAEQAVPQEGYWPGAPDLAVEVISPGDTYSEVEQKVFDWLEAGSRMVITVDARRRAVTVYRGRDDIVLLTVDDTLDGADVVLGWSLPVQDLFD